MPLGRAVTGMLNRDQERMPFILVAGGYGRGKTAQVSQLYSDCAGNVSAGGPLPLFVRMSSFEPEDVSSEVAVARAITRTYRDKTGLVLDEAEVRERFSDRCVLVVDNDGETDDRGRNFAFDSLLETSAKYPKLGVVATASAPLIRETASLREAVQRGTVSVLLLQLLSRSSLGQYLDHLPGGKGKELHATIRALNLFDIASVPWLLSSLMGQSGRTKQERISRSGTIKRIVESNFAGATWPPGTRQLVPEFLARLAWTLQTQRSETLSGRSLYRLLADVRGDHEIPIEQIRSTAIQTQVVCPTSGDGIRFAYPGLQSYWCAVRLNRMGARGGQALEDVTATLGRRSRVRLWQDTLVLLAGLTDDASLLVQTVMEGGELRYGEHVFIGATCAHEARLSGKAVSAPLISQMLDTLIWRSTAAREHSGTTRIRAVEALGLLGDDRSVPHLVSLALDAVRPSSSGVLKFELSAVRHAAIQVLVTLPDAARAHISQLAARPGVEQRYRELPGVIDAWMSGDSERLRTVFESRQKGLPAVIAIALATLGGQSNLDYLIRALADPAADPDTRWGVADALLAFDAHEVHVRVCADLIGLDHLSDICAYLIGKLQIYSEPGAIAFLESCVKESSARTRGLALRAFAELGDPAHRTECESLAIGDSEKLVDARAIAVPEAVAVKTALRRSALEALRLIGDRGSMMRLRESHAAGLQNPDPASLELMQLSYEVSEDIYWRTSGRVGDEGASVSRQLLNARRISGEG